MIDIYIVGDIDTDAFRRFSKSLAKFESNKELVKNRFVNVLLMSDGGSATTALGFLDRIRLSKLNIRVIATGQVASAAGLILAAGDHRVMTPSSWVMVHEDSLAGIEGQFVNQIEKVAKHGRRMEEQWSNIFAHLTKTPKDKWLELHKNETYLNAQECLELGLIDEILE